MASPTLTFLGTGTAFNHDGRGSQSLLVQPDHGSPFLVDAGPTLMVPLMREGGRYSDIDRLFLTHLHGDHVAGWPFLLLHYVILEKRTRPFDIYGPVGTREVLEGLARLCYGDVLQLRRFDLRFHEFPVADRQGLDVGAGMTLDTIPMRHHVSSLGLCFHLPFSDRTRSFAVSGDTGWCEGLERLARSSELLIMECTSVDPTVETHVSLAELRRKVARLETDQIVLIHLTDEVARNLAIDPMPGVVAVSDGTVWAIGGPGEPPG